MEVAPGGDVGIAATPLACHFCHPVKLVGEQDSPRYAATKHERILHRCHVEKAVVLVTEDIAPLGKTVRLGVGDDCIPDIKPVALELDLLLLA